MPVDVLVLLQLHDDVLDRFAIYSGLGSSPQVPALKHVWQARPTGPGPKKATTSTSPSSLLNFQDGAVLCYFLVSAYGSAPFFVLKRASGGISSCVIFVLSAYGTVQRNSAENSSREFKRNTNRFACLQDKDE